MAKSENVVSEDGQRVEVKYPGVSLQDQARHERELEKQGDPNEFTLPQAELDKDLMKVREIRAENERRAGMHNRTEIHRTIEASSRNQDTKAKPIEFHVFGQRAYINTHGEAVLDREGVIELRRACEHAFQAVS